MSDLLLSDKEQALLNFIKEKKEVTIKQIEAELSVAHTGALGRLLGNELIKSEKKRKHDPRNVYGVKYVKHYRIKEETSNEKG